MRDAAAPTQHWAVVLTPTLKVKRRVIEKNYKGLIDSLYDATDPAMVALRE